MAFIPNAHKAHLCESIQLKYATLCSSVKFFSCCILLIICAFTISSLDLFFQFRLNWMTTGVVFFIVTDMTSMQIHFKLTTEIKLMAFLQQMSTMMPFFFSCLQYSRNQMHEFEISDFHVIRFYCFILMVYCLFLAPSFADLSFPSSFILLCQIRTFFCYHLSFQISDWGLMDFLPSISMTSKIRENEWSINMKLWISRSCHKLNVKYQQNIQWFWFSSALLCSKCVLSSALTKCCTIAKDLIAVLSRLSNAAFYGRSMHFHARRMQIMHV